MRFNHMELTFARGSLDEGTRSAIDAFYGDLMGWRCSPYELFGQLGHLLVPDEGQFLLLMESDDPISSPGPDHLGLLLDSRAEVDALHDACLDFAEKDDRLEILDFDDLVNPRVTQHLFYVRYLLPLWFDVHSLEYPSGGEPSHRWTYLPGRATPMHS
jgi:hypothetical protein